VKKNKLIKATKYLSNKRTNKNIVATEENEENIKIYFVKHLGY